MAEQGGAARRLWALDGGRITEARGNLVAGDHGMVTIICPTFLIEHGRGLVLIDTGLSPAAAADPHLPYGELADQIEISLTAEQCVDRQLAALGYRPGDVDHVLLSHLHLDHTGGIHLFPRARLHAMSGELENALRPEASGKLYRRADLEPALGFGWDHVGGDELDLFGDRSIRMLRLPGHTPGNSSIAVRLPGRTILLACDTAHLYSGLEAELPMPSDPDPAEAVRSIRRLRQLARELDAMLWLPHELSDWARYRHAPEAYE